MLSKDGYKQSYEALSALKAFRKAVETLSSAIDTSIKALEEAVRPVARHYGIRSLPNELMLQIMSLVANQLLLYPKRLETMMEAFRDIAPFGGYFKFAREEEVKNWRHIIKSYWEGEPPAFLFAYARPQSRITSFSFLFNGADRFSPNDLCMGLKYLGDLENLSLDGNFLNEENDGSGHDLTISLPRLKSLSVGNHFEQRPGRELSKACVLLGKAISMIDAPNLESIKAEIRIKEKLASEDANEVLDKMFGFPDRVYPSVSTLR